MVVVVVVLVALTIVDAVPCICCFSTSNKNVLSPACRAPEKLHRASSLDAVHISLQHKQNVVFPPVRWALEKDSITSSILESSAEASTCMLARAVASRRMQSHQHNEVLSFLTFGTNSRSPPRGLYVSGSGSGSGSGSSSGSSSR